MKYSTSSCSLPQRRSFGSNYSKNISLAADVKPTPNITPVLNKSQQINSSTYSKGSPIKTAKNRNFSEIRSQPKKSNQKLKE